MKRKLFGSIAAIMIVFGVILFSVHHGQKANEEWVNIEPTEASANPGQITEVICCCNFWGKCRADGRQSACNPDQDGNCDNWDTNCGIF